MMEFAKPTTNKKNALTDDPVAAIFSSLR